MRALDSHSDEEPVRFDQDCFNVLARELHDFRAPLTAFNGYCALLCQEQLGPLNAVQSEVLRRMQKVAQRLSQMAAAMYDTCAGKDREHRLRRRPVDVKGVVEQAVYQIAPMVDDKQLSLSINLDLPAWMPEWDENQIEQVLINLLENACKFCPRGGAVEVRGYPVEGACYRIDVRDSGPGVAPEVVPFVFDEYFSHPGSDERGGTGLGLAICQSIVRAHGGRIWVESLDDGSVFSLELPLRELAQDTESLTMAAATSLQ
ncbi:MAG TPA: HAMP domain-containing sensor histidine kinase [Bryobacteraceae bacterium]|nr:HAMP domain-containing sensor histidine kinase [Bryobacteraceae bacterium]